ncbi:helix-loop-helix DNA-binding domain-containing protein [Fimicolochytrium jonesii]|uniref:helix-loop-helix DNA-binding domain-containing protein n=1 Tax=Fimicolochytrium jonesii TaxID=1396493 RepID=UPI0022FE9423|nr:helix-loop-helix DNA-binding domain-containing protein [Fimicolochytrium jonesii]KAI8820214.1 helix-loop-helix DNA-binding domain-containing protein [Fimicolochytrium jonesii]
MLPVGKQSASPHTFPVHHPHQQQQQQQQASQAQQQDIHGALIISHQPFDGKGGSAVGTPPQHGGLYPQQQLQNARLASPPAYNGYPMQQTQPQPPQHRRVHHQHQPHTHLSPQHQMQAIHTIDPNVLSMSQHFGGVPGVKQEDSVLGEALTDPYLNVDYDLGNGVEIGDSMPMMADPTALMSPMSNSPLDDADLMARSATFSPHGSGSLSNSLHSTPYVHATNGFGIVDHTKLMGTQPSSYSAYGHGLMLPDPTMKNPEVLNEKRRRRRESHNAVERRRRDNINEKIQELATLLPDFANDLQNRPNKGVILRRSVDYIRQMQTFAMMQVDRAQELERVLARILDQTGINEAELGLTLPLGTLIEMPTVKPPGPNEQHPDQSLNDQGLAEYDEEGDGQ